MSEPIVILTQSQFQQCIKDTVHLTLELKKTSEGLTIKQVAEQLHLSPATVRTMIADGRLKASGTGKMTRIPSTEPDRYLNSNPLKDHRSKS